MQFSTRVRNGRADAVEVAIGVSPALEIWSGALPANCAAADAGTLLASLPLPSDWMAAGASGAKAKSGTWQDTAANASGLGRHYRIRASDAAVDVQGLVSQAWVASTAYILNQHVNNGGNVYKCTTAGTSAGSGGPTGTGTSITDGSAVWDYVGAAEMVLDNTNIGVGQQVTISTFGWTEGNA